MADPFEALHLPLEPIDPDPAFAARLRARLVRALTPSEGVPLTDLTLAPETAASRTAGAALTPYLAVADARRALDWYVEGLGARPRGEPIVMPDGRIGHAELDLGGALVILSDEHPEIGVSAPRPGEGATVTLHLQVGNVDKLAARAVDAGAVLERAPADQPYGRNAVIRDPFGHRWMLASEVQTAPADDGYGEVAYVSLWVPDVDRAATFFSAVLGWTYAPGSGPQGRQVQASTPRHGLWGGQEHSTLFLCFAVEDVPATLARVRAAGGEAQEPRHEPYGLIADCVDNQGLAFAVIEVPAPRRAAGGTAGGRPGDIAYLTMEVVDSGAARDFYSSVLGWRFAPGHSPGGWDVENVTPKVGLAGGAQRATVVPMYRVDDIRAAVERVRAAGGAATDPERQPYGLSSSCSDDQGTRFYLGEL
jgi:predicted enzyme related to lactoylglutathione lyase